jgi:hypothetical protein
MPGVSNLDLVVLVPDKQMEATLRSLLQRHASLRVRPFSFEILVHPRRDPGCRSESPALLSIYASRAKFALVLFDREGCGEEQLPREMLESSVEAVLAAAGWSGRSSVVVISPELEAWVWSDSPVVDQAVGWTGLSPSLRQWLISQGFVVASESKPSKPKEALEAALKKSRKRRSASIYGELAARVSLGRCTDPAFQKLKTTLLQWFAA